MKEQIKTQEDELSEWRFAVYRERVQDNDGKNDQKTGEKKGCTECEVTGFKQRVGIYKEHSEMKNTITEINIH